jgi:hypothetical protein
VVDKSKSVTKPLPFLREELDYIRSKSKPYSDLDFEFNRALNHWERLIQKLTASSNVTPSHLQDSLQELAAQTTSKGRIAEFNDLGPTWHIDFPLERWTISLALFFEFLSGETLHASFIRGSS